MKTLFIIRGLPNAGKTTLARILAPKYNVAADDFHTNSEGNYIYNPSRVGECHALCQWGISGWLRLGRTPVAVHNTFTRSWEMAPYVKMAEEAGYRLVVLTVERSHDGDNGHGVADSTVRAMRERWEAFKC